MNPAATGPPRRETFVIETDGPGLYEFTDRALRFCADRRDGMLSLFLRHTSASLLIQENADPDVCADLQSFLTRLVPRGDDPAMRWLTHVLEGPDDMPAHIRAALLPVSLSIPVADGRPMLGRWQGIYLFEHRETAHRRQVVAQMQ